MSKITKLKSTLTHKKPFYLRLWFIIPIVAAATILLWFRLSPVPGAFVIRTLFDLEANTKKTAMQAFTPDVDVTVRSDVRYGEATEELLDVYTPTAGIKATETLPVVVWTHGGAWLSGDKADSDTYFKKLAAEGFIVVAPNYTLAPRAAYPTQINQLNKVLAYVVDHATELSIDPERVVLAGDSAGAQLASQMAAIATNTDYARSVAISPAITASQLSGVALFCGIYQVDRMAEKDTDLPKIVGWGMDITVWSFTGSRRPDSHMLAQASAYYNVTADYPPTFISGGNGDSLTKSQSIPFSEKLVSLGVPTTTLFYADNHEPSLPHENQFIFDADGIENFRITVEYLKSLTEKE